MSQIEPDRKPEETPFFKAGAEARRAGIKLQDSALRKLRPGCKEYDWFIAGYDSNEQTQRQTAFLPTENHAAIR